jgi:hypothetical protein
MLKRIIHEEKLCVYSSPKNKINQLLFVKKKPCFFSEVRTGYSHRYFYVEHRAYR